MGYSQRALIDKKIRGTHGNLNNDDMSPSK